MIIQVTNPLPAMEVTFRYKESADAPEQIIKGVIMAEEEISEISGGNK